MWTKGTSLESLLYFSQALAECTTIPRFSQEIGMLSWYVSASVLLNEDSDPKPVTLPLDDDSSPTPVDHPSFTSEKW